MDWAEDLQRRIDAEAEQQSGTARQHVTDKKEHGEQERPGGKDQDQRPPPQQLRNQKGKNSPRRLTRQMTLARELSTDDKNPRVKTLSDMDQAGTTAWVGGLPYELAVDKDALHDLLSEHGGDLKAITVRLKPAASAGGPNKSWCFATFRNEDAVERLQQAAAAAAAGAQPEPEGILEPKQPSSLVELEEEALTPVVAKGDVEYTFERASPCQSPPQTPAVVVAGSMLSLVTLWPPSMVRCLR